MGIADLTEDGPFRLFRVGAIGIEPPFGVRRAWEAPAVEDGKLRATSVAACAEPAKRGKVSERWAKRSVRCQPRRR
jgi:hypothetical protein